MTDLVEIASKSDVSTGVSKLHTVRLSAGPLSVCIMGQEGGCKVLVLLV